MDDLENSFVDGANSLDDVVQDAIEESENKQNEDKKGLVKKSVDWVKRKYRDFLIYNGELLIAEGVASVAGAGAGELLGNYIENDLVITGGTVIADTVTYLGAFGFMAGDGVIDAGEDCDGSVPQCRVFKIGGTYNPTGSGNPSNYNYGETACTDCLFDTSSCSVCGNSMVDGIEECDGFKLGGETCESLGFPGGFWLQCDNCVFDTSGC